MLLCHLAPRSHWFLLSQSSGCPLRSTKRAQSTLTNMHSCSALTCAQLWATAHWGVMQWRIRLCPVVSQCNWTLNPCGFILKNELWFFFLDGPSGGINAIFSTVLHWKVISLLYVLPSEISPGFCEAESRLTALWWKTSGKPGNQEWISGFILSNVAVRVERV